MKNAIAYERVSTGPGRSGLGLEAQRATIARFAAQEGFRIVESFAEAETGKGADALARRPKLAAALKAARRIDNGCPVIDSFRTCRYCAARPRIWSWPPPSPRHSAHPRTPT